MPGKKKISKKQLRYHRKLSLWGRGIVIVGVLAIFALFILSLNILKNILIPVPAQLINQTRKENNKTLNYEITVTYPQIVGVGNIRKQADINEKIKAIIDKSVIRFKNEIAQIPSNIPVDFPSSLLVKSTVERTDGKILSILFTVEDYPRGAAHPFNYTQTFTYAMKESRQLTLSDIFVPDSDYLQQISDYCAADLKKQYAQTGDNFDQFIKDGTKPTDTNFSKFVLTSTGLMIVFDQGTVGPESAGMRTVVIPYAMLPDSFENKFKP